MNFRTPINPKTIAHSELKINYQTSVALFGSCFVEHIGERLDNFKFKNLVNPYGILFHPLAIEKLFTDLIIQKKYTLSDLIFDQNTWHSPHHHSDFSHSDSSSVLQKIQAAVEHTTDFVKNTNFIIITLGTAWVYHHIERDELVANCHKIPATHFVKRLLSIQEISASLEKTIQHILQLNKDAKILWTISPVRHLRDGMVENNKSKSHLLAAVHDVVQKTDTYYFPSYEIMLDDLRDYRFYEKDMIHPNEIAIDYIWDIFKNTWIEPKMHEVMHEVADIQKALKHKVFQPNSEKHLQFMVKIQGKIKKLETDYNIYF